MNVLAAVRARRSIRNYRSVPLATDHLIALEDAASQPGAGPFGGACRFEILRPTRRRPRALEGLTGLRGTYGFIRHAQAFAVAAVGRGARALEDFGYLMEGVVLQAAALGVASCWLGGAFHRQRFSRAMSVSSKEWVPAVVSLGYDLGRKRLLLDAGIELHHCYRQRRRPWAALFFDDNTFGLPLDRTTAGVYRDALEAVQLAPSSCNTQTWRIVRESPQRWHLFLQRNRRYARKDRLVGNADLQRIDMGIAMRHFEEVARERGCVGQWRELPAVQVDGVPSGVEYVASWCE